MIRKADSISADSISIALTEATASAFVTELSVDVNASITDRFALAITRLPKGASIAMRKIAADEDANEADVDVIAFSLTPQVLSDEGYEALKRVMAAPIAQSTLDALPLPIIPD